MSFLIEPIFQYVVPLLIGEAVGQQLSRGQSPSLPNTPQFVQNTPPPPPGSASPAKMPAPNSGKASNANTGAGETTVGTEGAIRGTPPRRERKRRGRMSTILTDVLGDMPEFLG